MNHLFEHLHGAFADNTLRAYRADFKVFSVWCADNEIDPLSASATEIANFVTTQAEHRTTATIRRRIASISTLLKLNSYSDPTSSPEVILALKRIHRQKGRAQKQAQPLTKDILEQLVEVTGDDLVGMRDRVLLMLGNETMRRRSELCNFRFEDIEYLAREKVGIWLRFSKTDQFGQGKFIPISPTLGAVIENWRITLNVNDGYILREVTKTGRVQTHMRPSSINLRLKVLQRTAKLNHVAELSGHSFRVGGAIDLLEAGESLEKIMLRGGWKSESTALRYLRNWQAFP